MALTATLTLDSDVSQTAGMSKTGATTYFSQVNETSLNTATRIGSGSTIGTGYSAEFTMTNMPSATGIDSVTFYISAGIDGSDVDDGQRTRAFIRHSGTRSNETWVHSNTTTARTWTLATNPVTGTAWTPAAINALQCGVELEYGTAAGSFSTCWMMYAVVTYTPMAATVEVARHIASVELRLRQRPESMLKFDGNLDLLGLTWPLGAVDVEHTAAPHATDLGWEDEAWQLRPFALHGLDIDLNNLTVSSTLKDQEPLLCLVRDLAWSDKASGTLLDGIARFATPGATFNFSRASDHTYTNAVGESETATTDQPAYSSWGLYMLSSSGGRAAPRYYVTNNSTARTLNAAQGSFQAEVKLAAVSASDEQTVAACVHDASNWWWLYWDGINGWWVFEIRQAGSTYRAVKSASPSSGVAYQIGARWTGSNGELGLSPYTLDVFVDRVKGTSAVAGGAMTQAASANFDFGTSLGAGFDQLNGEIRKIHSYQRVLTDVQMQRAI